MKKDGTRRGRMEQLNHGRGYRPNKMGNKYWTKGIKAGG